MSTHSFNSRSNRPVMQALTGGFCGLAMAALLALAVSFAFSGRALGQENDPRYECEAGARDTGATGRALGACDLLLRDASVTGETRARVLTNRAVMLLARGQNIQARSDLEEAVELSPELAEAWLNLSAAQIATGSAQAAIDTARQARELGASPPRRLQHRHCAGDPGPFRGRLRCLFRSRPARSRERHARRSAGPVHLAPG